MCIACIWAMVPNEEFHIAKMQILVETGRKDLLEELARVSYPKNLLRPRFKNKIWQVGNMIYAHIAC